MSAALFGAACSETLHAGSTAPHGPLPVDERNPVVLVADGATDNWLGVYAVLLANGPGPGLAGIVVNGSKPWPDLDKNVSDWTALVAAATQSGLRGIPEPVRSEAPPLVRPPNGDVVSTRGNQSAGAQLIAKTARETGRPYRPLAVVTGGPLTDVAEAYLIDPSIADRVVVVAALGGSSASGGTMAGPNGDLDPWADAIVAGHLKYVQISGFYDQLADVTGDMLGMLPQNSLGQWIADKQPGLWKWQPAADQVAIIALGIPQFSLTVGRMSVAGSATAAAGPGLEPNSNGNVWLVSEVAASIPEACLWDLLLNSKTYGQ